MMKCATIRDLVENGDVAIKTGPFGTQLKASEYVSQGTVTFLRFLIHTAYSKLSVPT